VYSNQNCIPQNIKQTNFTMTEVVKQRQYIYNGYENIGFEVYIVKYH
jgi:hypothetical protein